VEDLAEGSVKDNFFIFLEDFGFVGEGKRRLSDSEESADVEGHSWRASTIEEST
jgi:hypothetical protein